MDSPKDLGFFSEVGVIVIRQSAVNWAAGNDRSDLCSNKKNGNLKDKVYYILMYLNVNFKFKQLGLA